MKFPKVHDIKKLLQIGLLTVFTLLCSSAATAQHQEVLPTADCATVAMSRAELNKVVNLFTKQVAEDQLRGAVLLVARRGKIVLHTAIGWKDASKMQPMQTDSLFHIASNSKAITATVVLSLIAEGKLKPEDAVADHLPAFRKPGSDKITVHHLLTHTSGLQMKGIFLKPLMSQSAAHPHAPNLQLEVARFAKIGPKTEPGKKYLYSNAGYNSLGALIEVVSGKSLADNFQQQIFDQLQMQNSYVSRNSAPKNRMVTVLKQTKQKGWQVKWKPGDSAKSPFPRASGGLVCTAKDYAKFCQMILNDGTFAGKRMLPGKLITTAQQPQVKNKQPSYGYGWVVGTSGDCWHGGSDGTWAWIDRERELIGLIFTQCQTKTIPRKTFQRLVRKACIDKPKDD